VRLFPELPRDREGVDFNGAPPFNFVAGLVELSMMAPTEGTVYSSLTLTAQRAGLREAKMMRIGRMATAYETGLGRHKAQV
jgi:hypothetical protein